MPPATEAAADAALPPALPGAWAGAASRIGWGLLGFLLLLLGWQVLVTYSGLPEVVLPSPSAVVVEIAQKDPMLIGQGLVTLQEILIGLGLSIVIGFPLAICIAFSRILSRLLYPLLIVSQAVPKVAVAPLFLIWFGFSAMSNALLALLIAVFPIVINTTLGLSEINPELVQLGRIMGGNGPRVFWKIRFPAALPSIFAGLKLSMTLATIGAIVGELVAGQRGLGYLSQFAAGQLDTVLTFACIVAMSLLGLALFYAVVLLEFVTIRWRPA